MHKPIQSKGLELSFPHKTCFANFNCQVTYGTRIAIIGCNGSGKSTLLKMLAGICEPYSGVINISDDVVRGYVPQVIETHSGLSGGQSLNVAITEALSVEPNILLLDEPTNHLDKRNHDSLIRMLQSYAGTLIVVSHDTKLLRNCIDSLWHIDDGKIHIFCGNYDDYTREIKLKRSSIEDDLAMLKQQKKDMHDKFMREQQRAAKSRIKGKKNVASGRWTKMACDLKTMTAEKSHGKKLKAIDKTKQDMTNQLAEWRLPKIIIHKFCIENHHIDECVLVRISDGQVGYLLHEPLLSNISFTVTGKERIAIIGDNGSGKSTLIKAIMGGMVVYENG
jgi:ATPase subunit of ABC transporter with duplicated ATPase domains